MIDSLKNAAFRIVWRNWLSDGDRIVRVTGWRSALIEDRFGIRRHANFCPFRWTI